MTILLADAGSTKTDWVKLTLSNEGEIYEDKYTGAGINPNQCDTDFIEEELRLVRAALGEPYSRICFYGAGIGSPMAAEKMETVLSEIFRSSDIHAESDIEGAARSVLDARSGIACIMGTGSNTCHYDGIRIDRKPVSLGYILDDDGGGVGFGRRLLCDIFKGIAPDEIIKKFNERYAITVKDVVDHLYHMPAPASWIASFMPFVIENANHPYISVLIESQLARFFDREFLFYPDYQLKEEGIGFVGSVAVALSDRIKREMDMRGWKLVGITAKPLENLKNLELATIISSK